MELYKTINKLNPNFMGNLFDLELSRKDVSEKYKMNMIITEFR